MLAEWALLIASLLLATYSGGSLLSAEGESAMAVGNRWSFRRIARQLEVQQAGVSAPLFVALSLIVSAAIGISVAFSFNVPLWFGYLAAVTSTLTLLALLKNRASKHVLAFERQLADSLDVMHAATESGYTVASSLKVTAEASQPFLRRELMHVETRLQQDRSIEHATARMAELYDTEVVRLVVQLLVIGWHNQAVWPSLLQTGKAIARQRVALRARLAGKLSGSRYAVLFVAALPYVLVPFFLSHDPYWLQTLLTHDAGPTLFLTALALQLLGLSWMQKILRLRG